MSGRLKILLIDDHPLVRRVLTDFLNGQNSIDVIGGAEDGETGVKMAVDLHPDVVLMDFHLPGINGDDATRRLLAILPETVVIGASSDDYPPVRSAMMEAGASHFFLKGDRLSHLVDMIHEVADR